MILFTLQNLSKVHQCKICYKPLLDYVKHCHTPSCILWKSPIKYTVVLQDSIQYTCPTNTVLAKTKSTSWRPCPPKPPGQYHETLSHLWYSSAHADLWYSSTYKLTFPGRWSPNMSLVQILNPTIAILAAHCVLLSAYGLPALLFLFKIDPHLREWRLSKLVSWPPNSKTYTNHLQSLSRIIYWGANGGFMVSFVFLEG